jgi:hypothetical protein
MSPAPTTPETRPMNPLAVLALAIVLPGSGQVFNREPQRGLIFLFFMFLLGAFTILTAKPEVSIVGKLAGGLFVYAISVFDAYKKAKIRLELWRYAQAKG